MSAAEPGPWSTWPATGTASPANASVVSRSTKPPNSKSILQRAATGRCLRTIIGAKPKIGDNGLAPHELHCPSPSALHVISSLRYRLAPCYPRPRLSNRCGSRRTIVVSAASILIWHTGPGLKLFQEPFLQVALMLTEPSSCASIQIECEAQRKSKSTTTSASLGSRLSACMPRIYDSRKRIPVTGGAGFLGSHLIDRLLDEGHEVLCVDNLFTGTRADSGHLET
jgi:hypothetical protein